jgi:hypothetical protein
MIKLKVDNDALAEEFFDGTRLLGIVGSLADYQFCWQLNQGMQINFTMNNDLGKRVNWIKVNGKQVQPEHTYTMLACEREGDPDDTLCRMEKVKNPRKPGGALHDIVRAYLAAHPMVSPKIEQRATATDAPSTLLSQLEGYDYEFI